MVGGQIQGELISWIFTRPYWEQFLWATVYSKKYLAENDYKQMLELMLEEYGLVTKSHERPPINLQPSVELEKQARESKYLLEISSLKNVNAIPGDQSIVFCPNLNLIYGNNGSGKSGYTRLLSSACVSRGDRTILPNVYETPNPSSPASANFILQKSDGTKVDINYSYGEKPKGMQHFAVFDSTSARIHISESTGVTSIVPAQLTIFQEAILAINKLETFLQIEITQKTKQNPVIGRFNGDSRISQLCNGLSSQTDLKAIEELSKFSEEDEQNLNFLNKELEDYKKLDVTAKKKALLLQRQELEGLYNSLEKAKSKFTTNALTELKEIYSELKERTERANILGAQQFNDGLFSTIGSPEWRALLLAAKQLWEAEKDALGNKSEPEHCPLCHQALDVKAKTLFNQYWQFLEGKAQAELNTIKKQGENKKAEYKHINIPTLGDSDSGARILLENAPELLIQLRSELDIIKEVASSIADGLGNCDTLDVSNIPTLDLTPIQALIDSNKAEDSSLVDPIDKIKVLEAEIIFLTHKKVLTQCKHEVVNFVLDLAWIKKAQNIKFPKKLITEKQKELFNKTVTRQYITQFNTEAKNLNCDFGIKISTRGEKGATVKELRLTLAENHKPATVLSEGEQRVCALADFLTEITMDTNNFGIVFDDPVNSLDHERKRKIAERLVVESRNRQVIIFTHDRVFMSYLYEIATNAEVPMVTHWISRKGNEPGHIELNTGPRLSCLASIRDEIAKETKKAEMATNESERERHLGVSFDLLRSCCEALIIEVLFAKTVQRHEDQVRVSNLEEVPWDEGLALKIVDMHGRFSRYIPAHNRSDQMLEEPLTIELFKGCFEEFRTTENSLKQLQKDTRKLREQRSKIKTAW